MCVSLTTWRPACSPLGVSCEAGRGHLWSLQEKVGEGVVAVHHLVTERQPRRWRSIEATLQGERGPDPSSRPAQGIPRGFLLETPQPHHVPGDRILPPSTGPSSSLAQLGSRGFPEVGEQKPGVGLQAKGTAAEYRLLLQSLCLPALPPRLPPLGLTP